MKCALSGHRSLPKDFDEAALSMSLEELIGENYLEFYCGMAEGFDLTALKCLFKLRERYPILIEACVPFVGQERRFREANQKFYREALPLCDRKTFLSQTYFDGCFHLRNRYMVDSADLLFAYCVKHSGGTYYTVNYAKEQGKKVLFFST